MDAETQLAEFVARFSPEVQDRIRDCRSKVEARFPTAVQLIYDNYNFLVISFGPTDRPSDVVLSLAAYASGLNLNFLQRGPELPDPASILRGSGKVVRNVRLDAQEDLDRPEVIALIDRGLSNKEIAQQLNLELATVKNHVHNILEKLNVASRHHAARLARAGARNGSGHLK